MAFTPKLRFGPLLKHLRKQAGMTQRDLAAALGYSDSLISNLEKEQRQPDLQAVMQWFIPALGLQDDPQAAAQLIEQAALARGIRPPAAVALQRTTRVVIQADLDHHPARLPLPPTALIGRAAEVKQLGNRLLGHSGRLLTLVGPPGVGKTTLALAVGATLQEFYADGACFVPLAAVNDPALVAATLVTALKLPDSSSKPAQTRLIEHLRRKEMLLLLDNFEQIIAAAPLLAELLAECARLHLLVTSRERLHLRAEQRFCVPSLSAAAAVELFVQRAQAVESAFTLTTDNTTVIHELCRRLDYLPLGIELLASRIDLYTPQVLLARLQDHSLDLLIDGPCDLPIAHRTLRSAIHHSYILLDERERALFRTLGVFIGGFDLATVAHFGFVEAELQALVHKNLVKAEGYATGTQRFLLLETLRAYAVEQLAQTNENEIVQRTHALYFFELAKYTHKVIYEGSTWDTKSVNAMSQEVDNVRLALNWIAMHEPTLELPFLNYLYELWDFGVHRHEIYRWSEAAWLRIQPERTLDYAFFLCTLASIQVYHYGDFVTAQRYAEESLALFRQVQHPFRDVQILKVMAHIHQERGDIIAARALIEEGVAIARAEGHPGGLAFVLLRLRTILLDLGDQITARTLLHEIVALWRSHNGPGWQSQTLRILAQDAFLQGDLSLARTHCEEALHLSQRINETATRAESLLLLSQIIWRQGDKAGARALLDELLLLAREDSPTRFRAGLLLAGLAAQENGDPVRAQMLLLECLTLVQEKHILQNNSSQAFVAYLLCGLAGLLASPTQAAQLLGIALRLRETASGLLYFVVEQAHYERILAAVRAQLDEASFTNAHTAGYAMTTDQAVAWVLAHFAAPKQGT